MGINVANGVTTFAASGGTVTTPAKTTQVSGSTFLIVASTDVGGTSLNTPTDSKGNIYTPINTQFTMNWGGFVRAWYCENAVGGTSHTFTATNTAGASAIQITAIEITGGRTSGILDQFTAWLSDASSPYTTNTTGTTAQANELALVFEGTDTSAATAITWGNGYAVVPGSEETDAAHMTGGFGYKVLSATGTEQGSITATNSVAGNGIVITFKESALGPAINAQPESISGIVSATPQFSISATTSGGSLRYQWQSSPATDAAVWTNVSDGSPGPLSTFTVPALTSADNGTWYRCVVTDDNGDTISARARVWVANLAITGKGRYL